MVFLNLSELALLFVFTMLYLYILLKQQLIFLLFMLKEVFYVENIFTGHA